MTSRETPFDPAMERLGTVTQTGDRIRLDYERIIDATPDLVWRALVDPIEAAKWWDATHMTIEPGVRYLIHSEKYPPGGPILHWDPPRSFSFEWNRDETGTPQVVTFTVMPEGERTRLHMSHEHLQPGWAESVLPGWHTVLVGLEASILDRPHDEAAVFNAIAPRYGQTKTIEELRENGSQ